MTIEVPFFSKFKRVISHRFIITFLISIHIPLRFLNGGGGVTTNNVMIIEYVGGNACQQIDSEGK